MNYHKWTEQAMAVLLSINEKGLTDPYLANITDLFEKTFSNKDLLVFPDSVETCIAEDFIFVFF